MDVTNNYSQKIIEIEKLVEQLLSKDKSGHDYGHIVRVRELAVGFCDLEKADKSLAILGALLHDVDDYKIFGQESADNLTNARKIMNSVNISKDIQKKVCDIINSMGYSKLLAGKRPTSLEGKIVSDADMCDAIGAIGILRWHSYTIAHDEIVFNKNLFPADFITVEEYKKQCSSCGDKLIEGNPINHYFDKLLKLNKLMLTKSGMSEARKRQQIMVDFLREYFRENNAPEWIVFLDKYLKIAN